MHQLGALAALEIAFVWGLFSKPSQQPAPALEFSPRRCECHCVAQGSSEVASADSGQAFQPLVFLNFALLLAVLLQSLWIGALRASEPAPKGRSKGSVGSTRLSISP